MIQRTQNGQSTVFADGRLDAAYKLARQALLAERDVSGHWIGELASSSLSTATAVSALALVERHGETNASGRFADEAGEARLSQLIVAGLEWLADAQNADGGWGDTDLSHSNIATTMLVRAAFHLTGVPAAHADLLERAEAYIHSQGGIPGLRRRYGKDKTFAVPILTNCALAGLVPWSEVSPLPFELATLPQSWYRFLRLPVVSYAIPALVAIGQARYFHKKPWNPLSRCVRALSVERSLRVLEQIQPASGGFLEATPLTSFVVMSLVSIGRVNHPVVQRGVQFLLASVREDGSWPIDTNLATWNSTLAVNALQQHREPGSQSTASATNGALPTLAASATNGESSPLARCLPWLLRCQNRTIHPYTGSPPGGWGWSDLSGSVPDADDTPGALLALSTWWHSPRESVNSETVEIVAAAEAGLDWLLDLQNRDGGWPTFCRGWGTMPFDRSGSDLTAHALRAIYVWQRLLRDCEKISTERSACTHQPRGANPRFAPKPDASACRLVLSQALTNDSISATTKPKSRRRRLARMDTAIRRGWQFLSQRQRSDGSWVPLWFGNQDHPLEESPLYGTARVLLAYRDLGQIDRPEAVRGMHWLAAQQNVDGGWGGWPLGERPPCSTVEETALAVEALLAAGSASEYAPSAWQGVGWLVDSVETKTFRECSPIGFYFAKLWYYERLYPLIFTVSALGQAVTANCPRRFEPQPSTASPPARPAHR